MRKIILGILFLGTVVAGSAITATQTDEEYLPLKAAPDYHKPVLENEFVLVLDVSIPPGATVPAHRHTWPAIFITLEPGHLIFKNLAGDTIREVQPPKVGSQSPLVEWREADSEPASVTNVGKNAQRALRVELKFVKR